MSYFLYTWPSDRLSVAQYGGSLIADWPGPLNGTEDPAYPSANLEDDQPARPAKLLYTYGAWLRSFPAPQQVDFCAIINHNIYAPAGYDWPVYLWGSSTPNIGVQPPLMLQLRVAGSVNPYVHVDGSPQNMFVDVASAVPAAINRTWQYWRLVINFGNVAPVAVGEWCLYRTLRNFGVRNISKGSTRTLHRPSITHTTDRMTRLSYDLGVSVREMNVNMEATDAVRFDVEQWFRMSKGTVRPFCIVPNYLQDEAWFVNFGSTDLSWTRNNNNHNPLSLRFQEVSKGLNL
jgi:hypothetical protein